jgi:hypothetical protein
MRNPNGDGAFKPRMAGAINLAHAALADQAVDLIGSQALSGG